ncbi:hypothetical protein EMCRGX_G000014 [Ephydatia muelleri]
MEVEIDFSDCSEDLNELENVARKFSECEDVSVRFSDLETADVGSASVCFSDLETDPGSSPLVECAEPLQNALSELRKDLDNSDSSEFESDSSLKVVKKQRYIDALFGNIGKWLKKNNALTVTDLLDGCKQANKMVQEAVPLSQMMDVKTWLLPHTEELHNHSNPHIFKFYRNADGHAEMKYKHWTQDSWEPSGNQPGLKLLKTTVNGVPGIVKPSPAKQDMDALSGSMSKFVCLHDTQKKWWTSFLSGLNDEFEKESYNVDTWVLLDIIAIVQACDKQDIPKSSLLPSQLVKRHTNITTDIPEVYIGHRRSKKKEGNEKTEFEDISEPATEVGNNPADSKIQPEEFVALGLQQYSDELPQVARVLALDGDNVTAEWWTGTYSGTWIPWMVKGQSQLIEVHKNCIVSKIALSKSNRLHSSAVKLLKEAYKSFEFM